MSEYLNVVGIRNIEQSDRFGNKVPKTIYSCLRDGNPSLNEFGTIADWVKTDAGQFDIQIGDEILPVYDRSGNLSTVLKK